jgi:hypothetical protein
LTDRLITELIEKAVDHRDKASDHLLEESVALERVKRLKQHKRDLRLTSLSATDAYDRIARGSTSMKTGDAIEGVERTSVSEDKVSSPAKKTDVENPG